MSKTMMLTYPSQSPLIQVSDPTVVAPHLSYHPFSFSPYPVQPGLAFSQLLRSTEPIIAFYRANYNAMPTTRRSTLNSPDVETHITPMDKMKRDAEAPVGELPILVGDGRYSPRYNMIVYDAVDYMGTRYRVGDHVCMNTPNGQEWVCVVESLFRENGYVSFQGRWFWNVEDVEQQHDSFKEPMRPSKCPTHELLACDSRDNNFVDLITRKCHILSYDNFCLIKKIALRSDYALDKVYFCDRQFYHKAFRFSELNNILFPGDPIPLALRKAAGLPVHVADPMSQGKTIINQAMLNGEGMNGNMTSGHNGQTGGAGGNGAVGDTYGSSTDDPFHGRRRQVSQSNVIDVDRMNAYYEPDYAGGKNGNTGKRGKKDKKDKSQNVSSQPIHIW